MSSRSRSALCSTIPRFCGELVLNPRMFRRARHLNVLHICILRSVWFTRFVRWETMVKRQSSQLLDSYCTLTLQSGPLLWHLEMRVERADAHLPDTTMEDYRSDMGL